MLTSLVEFEARMEEIDCLINAIPKKPSSKNAKTIDSLCRAGVVLLSSHLEGFLQDLMEEIVDEVNQLSISFKLLPLELYVQHSFPQGRIDQNNYSGILNILKELRALENSNVSFTLKKQNFSNTESNPTPEVINRLFQTLGERDVLDTLNRELLNLEVSEVSVPFLRDDERTHLIKELGMPNIIDVVDHYLTEKRNSTRKKDRNVGFYNTINTMLNYRNNIAHGNRGLRISDRDLIELKDSVTTLATELSKKATERLRNLAAVVRASEETASS